MDPASPGDTEASTDGVRIQSGQSLVHFLDEAVVGKPVGQCFVSVEEQGVQEWKASGQNFGEIKSLEQSELVHDAK